MSLAKKLAIVALPAALASSAYAQDGNNEEPSSSQMGPEAINTVVRYDDAVTTEQVTCYGEDGVTTDCLVVRPLSQKPEDCQSSVMSGGDAFSGFRSLESHCD